MLTMTRTKIASAVIAAAIVLTGGGAAVGSIPNAGPRLAFSGNGEYKVSVSARVADRKIKAEYNYSRRRMININNCGHLNSPITRIPPKSM